MNLTPRLSFMLVQLLIVSFSTKHQLRQTASYSLPMYRQLEYLCKPKKKSHVNSSPTSQKKDIENGLQHPKEQMLSLNLLQYQPHEQKSSAVPPSL